MPAVTLPLNAATRRPGWLLVPLLLLAAGCAHQPPLTADERAGLSQVRLDARWATDDAQATPSPQDLARWWLAFDDAQLQALVQQALQAHTDVRVARASLASAQAALDLARAQQQPILSAGASSSVSRRDGQGDSTRSQQLSLGASWEPDLWGAQAAGADAARWSLQAASADLAAARMAVAATTGRAYITRVLAQGTLALVEQSLQTQEATLRLVHWQQQAGLASMLDLQQARLSVAQTQASREAQRRSLAEADHALALLTGQTPDQLASRWRAVARLPQAHGPRVAQALAGAPADLLRRRPDLQAAEARLQAAWSSLHQVRQARWPGLALTGSVGLQAVTWSALGQPGAALASLAASLQGNLWDGGRQTAQEAQQQAALQQAGVAYDAALLAAARDAHDGLAALAAAGARQQSLTVAADAAQASLQLQQLRRDAGLIDVATLLEAERTALASRLDVLSAEAEGSLALITTWTALGGDWAEPTPVIPATPATPPTPSTPL